MFKYSRGFPFPFGPSKHENGINFSIVSENATGVTLCIFNKEEKSLFEVILDPLKNKTGHVWHIFIYDVPYDYRYSYRIMGPYDPLKGLFYDPHALILDPYCKLLATPHDWGSKELKTNADNFRKGIIHPIEPFHWEDDKHPRIPYKDLIIYEMHVRGFTQDPSSGVSHKGTFLGIIEKIPYLKMLGVNAVELMPIHEFPENFNPFKNPKNHQNLQQYWGYNSINFFSPMNRFGTGDNNTITEFKTMVKALHENGIEVILDVVYNHTAEGDQKGPLFSFKGLEAPIYYMLGPNGEYYNFSGCGNTFNCNHPLCREFIRDSLRYWVLEMHVDGFRFDLASILTRSHDGIPLQHPPLIEMIAKDPILNATKLIAEAWDAGGLYQVGSFPSMGVFSEWNGLFRDDVRRFIKGTEGTIGQFATRIAGSEDLYGKGGSPTRSINFITSHDGFTLADLVSYNQKHNEENGEDNRDGNNDNESWNCGIEGETSDPTILNLRKQQIKNHLVALFISQGVPMLLMGDEYGHTKNGNNNTWGHDSRLNWFQWDTWEKNQDLFLFTKKMISFRKQNPILGAKFLKEKDIQWHGLETNRPDWSPKSHFLAFTLPDHLNKYELFIAFNAHFTELNFKIPEGPFWKRYIDTSKNASEDFLEEGKEMTDFFYILPAYSSLLLKRKI